MRTLILVLATAIVAAVACGKDADGCSRNPIGPGCVEQLTISPDTSLLKIKATEVFSVTARGANGNGVVQAAWSSDTVAVATVDSAGRATGVAPGEATIIADYRGLRATRLLRVVPDYHGRWSGTHAVTACTADGAWQRVDACAEFPVGSLFQFALALNQARDAVTGTADFADGVPGPVDGPVRIDGYLALGGTFTVSVDGMTMGVAVTDWETLTTDNERMSGRFMLRFSVPGVDGSVAIGNDLGFVTKTSATPLVGRASGEELRTTLSALVRRLRRR